MSQLSQNYDETKHELIQDNEDLSVKVDKLIKNADRHEKGIVDLNSKLDLLFVYFSKDEWNKIINA